MWLNGRSSGLRFGSPGSLELTGFLIWLIRTGFILAHLNSDLDHRASSGLAFGSMEVIRLIRTLIWFIKANLGSSGLRFCLSGLIGAQCCSLGVISIQTRLNGGHLGSSGFRYGSSGLIRTHGDSDLAHLGRRLIGGRQGSSGLRSGSLGSSGVISGH